MNSDKSGETMYLLEFLAALGFTVGDKVTPEIKRYLDFYYKSSFRGAIPTVYVERFIQQERIQLILSPTPSNNSIPWPGRCCVDVNLPTCRISRMRNKITGILKTNKENYGYLDFQSIYSKVFNSSKSCCLNDPATYNYELYCLVRDRTVEYMEDEDKTKLYRISHAPQKRGPGRPNKWNTI